MSTLAARGISFAFQRSHPVLREVSLAFESGALTAIIGPNGAGKSSLLRVLLGTLAPQHGGVTLDEAPVSRIPRRERAARLAFVSQRPSVAFAFSTRGVVALGRFAHASDDDAVSRALDAMDMSGSEDVPFGTLSVGQQQRVAIARALAQISLPPRGAHAEDAPLARGANPFLLLDEPVSAMDPAHAIATLDLLHALSRRGVGVVVVLHDLGLVARYADQLAALDAAGRLAAFGPTRDTLTPDLLRRLFGVEFALLADPRGGESRIPLPVGRVLEPGVPSGR